MIKLNDLISSKLIPQTGYCFDYMEKKKNSEKIKEKLIEEKLIEETKKVHQIYDSQGKIIDNNYERKIDIEI